MIKWPITYVDFDGNEQTEEYRFHLSKSELMEMNFSQSGGMDKMLKRIINTKDTQKLIEVFKDIILRAYGELSDDGKRFVKVKDGHKLSDDFAQTQAYDELFMLLATDDQKAAEFINGIIPKALADEMAARG